MSGESKGGEGGESPDGGGGSSGSSILLRSSIHGSVSVQPFIRIGCCRFHAHLDRFKCFVRVSDSNHRRTKRYELVFARLVLFTRDSATDLEQKRFDNGCRCKYCNARGECNCVVEQRRNIMVDRERCVLFECSIDLNVGASGFLCPLLWCPQ